MTKLLPLGSLYGMYCSIGKQNCFTTGSAVITLNNALPIFRLLKKFQYSIPILAVGKPVWKIACLMAGQLCVWYWPERNYPASRICIHLQRQFSMACITVRRFPMFPALLRAAFLRLIKNRSTVILRETSIHCLFTLSGDTTILT